MPSSKRVQSTHMSGQLRILHDALLAIVGAMNRPQRDQEMVREAGISLDRALFPLLVVIERRGPIGIVELADGVGRDYTTVSRQVAKLESLDLVKRVANSGDRRVRKVAVTAKGKAMTDAVDKARERLARALFSTWKERDFENLVRLMRKLADAVSSDDADAEKSE